MLKSSRKLNSTRLSAAGVAAIVVLTVAGCQPTSTDGQNNSQTQTVAKQNAAAHWLTADTFLLNTVNGIEKAELVIQQYGEEPSVITLESVDTPTTLSAKFPHLSQFSAYRLPIEIDVKQALKGNIKLRQYKAGTLLIDSQVQTYGVLDAVYTEGANDADEVNDYGATVTESAVRFKVWSPTATKVEVLLFDKNKSPIDNFEMSENPATGAWSLTTTKVGAFDYYQYKIEVFHPTTGNFETVITTDPYSLSLSTDSKYSQIIDLNDSKTFPEDWLSHKVPTVDAPEDLILYETHIRDFSAADTALSNEEFRGKYKAFSETDSHGMKHLLKLRDAGLNTVHLLPTYDLSTIDENQGAAIDINDKVAKACESFDLSYCSNQLLTQKTIKELLQSFDPATREAGDLMEVIRNKDNYNWGYDPYHYTVPEGSYAVNPEGEARIIEFREMVTSLHNQGFRVIMDVVYNHTFASGLSEKSVLDKVVPNYYHRYHPITGAMERSTCCDNSATEHKMMEKLMVDSLVVWARDYKIDGFRFD
ncbi:MAG: DUF3372 domain-containing protein, partial [Gammaproteobacteria bacterium]|nr:DUF3372 domain-containing protein [Gammaproteobacteria bacterium]